MRVHLISAVVWLTMSLLVGARAAPPAKPELAPADLWISVFAGGNFGPGWWSLEITRPRQGRPRVSAGDTLQRELTPDEERTLSRLVAALPQAGKLEFGTAYIDVSTIFDLRVKGSKGWRRYSVTNTLEKDAGKAEIQPILRLLQFLYGLLGPTDRTPPPRPTGQR